MRKFNPPMTPAAAASNIALLPKLSDIEREAALKIPIKEASRELAKRLTADLDTALQEAIERYLGEPLTDPEIVRGRLTSVKFVGEEGDTYCVDGVPVLWAGPVTMTRRDDTMHGSRQLRQLDGHVAILHDGSTIPPSS